MTNICQHKNLRYARRTFQNKTVHFTVQCTDCWKAVKTKQHKGRLHIKLSDIPAGATIHDFINPNDIQGGN